MKLLGRARAKDILSIESLVDSAVLSREDPARWNAITELRTRFGHDERAFDSLVEHLEDPDWEDREGAIVALGRFGDRRAVGHLTSQLAKEQRYWTNRSEIVWALMTLGGAEALATVLAARRDPQRFVADAATMSIGKRPDWAHQSEAVLREALADASETSRWFAFDALLVYGLLSESEIGAVAETVAGNVSNVDQDLRERCLDEYRAGHIAAALVLGRTGDPAAVAALVDMLSREDPSEPWDPGGWTAYRAVAAEAAAAVLRRTGGPAAEAALVRLRS